MKIYLLKFISFLILFIFVIYGIDFLIQKGLKKSSFLEIKKWNEVTTGAINSEIVIIGSSRALVHFDPRVIENLTGKTCYNLGVNGNRYEVQKLILELYLEHNKNPEVLFWSIDLGTFQKTKGVFNYQQFIPYSSYPLVKKIFELNDGVYLNYLEFPLVRYERRYELIFHGLKCYFSNDKEDGPLVKGYREMDIEWNNDFDNFLKENKTGYMEDFNENLFHDFIKLSVLLKSKGIKVVWVIAPYYIEALELVLNSNVIFDKFEECAKMNKINFRNYSNTEFSGARKYFYNGSHLNKHGVEKFMKIFNLEYF